METLTPLYLKKGEERRIKAGHLWVFSNEVDTAKSSLKQLTPGQPVAILTGRGEFIANGYVNPNSLICARVVSRKPGHQFGPDLIRTRIQAALDLRQTLFGEPYYRMVFSEGDYLPGCIVDRFGSIASVQLTTAAMESQREAVVDTLASIDGIDAVLLKNDASGRNFEGLPLYVETAFGNVPEETKVHESGATFTVPLHQGQKTGWFYDMRLNRQRLARLAKDKSVLDVFSYAGGVGILAAQAGATEAVCVDASAKALDYAARSAEKSGVGDKVDTMQGDVYDVFQQLREDDRTFDIVSVDPPAFIKGKKDKKKGEQAYARVNREAMKLVRDGGLLMSCSCSQHMLADDLRKALGKAATQRRVRLQILEQGHQGPDHPVHPAMPETNYLKMFLTRMMK
ncbi:MAG: class I SAM-dependent rRNA methyltransferase [Desulfovibrio sp.]|uniref:class I SAM-dependent rRNA methyltransferase n=1 Tax=Desulfovibrio sp. 7SRBS1 TaxID=3378064 RepID=UPI003B3E02E6